MKKEIFLVLHNIRSLHNVGSIFRTADCAGVNKIYLTGYTSAPIDIFGKTKKEIKKTALGAEKNVEWEKCKDIGKLILRLKKDPSTKLGSRKIKVIALEQDSKSINYKKNKPKFPLALVVGNEVRGLSKQTLKKCDTIIEIPMHGKKESLNVSVATGIALFNLID